MSPASLGSYNLSGVGSISAKPIEHEIRHIMTQLWWENKLRTPWKLTKGPGNWLNEQCAITLCINVQMT